MFLRLSGFAFAIALMLSGCATQPVVMDSHAVVMDSHADVTTRMFNIASRFEQARHQGGMTGVTADIEKCYATAAFLVAKIFELRDCLVLDYVAYRSFGVAASPYFEPKTITARWTRYGAPAQFDTQNRLARYVQNAYSLVQADLAQMNAAPIVIHEPTTPHLASHL